MSSKTFNISLPEELVTKIDAQAKKRFSSRSDYIRNALLDKLDADSSDLSDAAVIKSAKKMLRDYDTDFKNLSQR